MNFDFTDAWVLSSIHHSEIEEGADLTSIIGYADISNHAIMTYAEFGKSAQKLLNYGVIKQQNNRFQTTDIIEEWWQKKFGGKQKINLLKTIEHVLSYLNKRIVTPLEKQELITVTETDFTESVTKYIELANR